MVQSACFSSTFATFFLSSWHNLLSILSKLDSFLQARKRAMNDPEVQKILNDPAMRMILEQMQNDPAAIQVRLHKTLHIQGDYSG